MTALNAEQSNRPRALYFLLALWGAEFRDHACRFTFPSLLAPGNIPALRYPKDARFLIVTTREDWQELRKQRIFQQLREQIQVEVIWGAPEAPNLHKYRRMAKAHAILADQCFEDRAIAVNLNPDSAFPDGCLAEGQRLVFDEGNDVVLCPAIRFDLDGVRNELLRRGLSREGEPLVIPMREAVDIGLANLHPESLASDWEAPNFARLHPQHERRFFLTCCFWRVPGEQGLVIITHNWAPFLVNYGVLSEHDSSTLDGRALDGVYIFENFPRFTDRIHVVRDSDNLFLLGLTPRAEVVPSAKPAWFTRVGPLSESLKGMILSRTVHDPAIDDHRRSIYPLYARWHRDALNEHWRATEAEVERLVAKYVKQDIDAAGADCPALERAWTSLARQVIY